MDLRFVPVNSCANLRDICRLLINHAAIWFAEKVKWTNAAVLVLIEQYRLMEQKFNSVNTKKKNVWLKIADVIAAETGLQFTTVQVVDMYC